MTDPTCERCGEARSKHALMNPHVYFGGSGEPALLLCPTALFLEREHTHEVDRYGMLGGAQINHCRCGATATLRDGVWGGWENP